MLTHVFGFFAVVFAVDNIIGVERTRAAEQWLLRVCELGYRSWNRFSERFRGWLVPVLAVFGLELLLVGLLGLTGYLLYVFWAEGVVFWLLLLVPGCLALLHQWLLWQLVPTGTGLDGRFVPLEMRFAGALAGLLEAIDELEWPRVLLDIQAVIHMSASILTGLVLPVVILLALTLRVAWIVSVGALVAVVFVPLNQLERLAKWSGQRLLVKPLGFIVMLSLWIAGLLDLV